MHNANVATWIAEIITAVWVASLVADGIWPTYDPPVTIHALMMAAAGWAFAGGYIHRQQDNNGG